MMHTHTIIQIQSILALGKTFFVVVEEDDDDDGGGGS